MKGAVDTFLESASKRRLRAWPRAMSARVLAGAGIDDEAGMAARRALGLAVNTPIRSCTFIRCRRRLAAVIGAYVCVLIGDVHRGTGHSRREQSRPVMSVHLLARCLVGCVARMSIRRIRHLQTFAAWWSCSGDEACAARSRSANSGTVRSLTHTELTLLRATATGKTNGEIAKERGVTRNAVERRLMSAYEKLGVKNRTEAIAKLAEI